MLISIFITIIEDIISISEKNQQMLTNTILIISCILS